MLDACCGTGASALPTAERVGPAGRRRLANLTAHTGDVPVPERPPHLVWLLVAGSGFRGMLAGLPPDQVERVRDRVVARLDGTALDGTALDATSLVGTGSLRG